MNENKKKEDKMTDVMKFESFTELNETELQQVEGGWIGCLFIIGGVIILCLLAVSC
jgi:lactobin A/cerein 7B family class IIb bacteriocin